MTGRDSVPLAEALQDVDALGGELEEGAFEREDREGLAVDGLNESSIDKALADGAGHFLGHGERGGRGGGDDPRRVLRVGHAVRLGELEGSQVVDCLLGGEGVIIAGEANPVRVQLQAYHQSGKQVHKILYDNHVSLELHLPNIHSNLGTHDCPNLPL